MNTQEFNNQTTINSLIKRIEALEEFQKKVERVYPFTKDFPVEVDDLLGSIK